MIDTLDTTALSAPIDPSVRGGWVGRSRRERDHRLASFAEANHLEVIPRIDRPTLPGFVFEPHQHVPQRWAEGVYRIPAERRVEFGEFVYVSAGAQMRRSYVAIELPEHVPNIVLDASSNQVLGLSSVPLPPQRSQRLSLEGDFDRTFSLSAPGGYEADALYLFTPDVMANFVDGASAFDVELVDNWAILSTPGPFDRLDPEAWNRRVAAVNAILAKVDQWARWRDDRVAANTDSGRQTATEVAPEGRRLRGGSGVQGCLLGLLGIIVVGAIIFLPFLLPAILESL